MAMPGLIRNFVAAAALEPYQIVKWGSNDGEVLPADSATVAIIGVTTDIGADSGERADVTLDGIANVKLGGDVTRGDRLTSDSSGHAVTAAPATGVNNNIIGRALTSGTNGEVIEVIIDRDQIQG